MPGRAKPTCEPFPTILVLASLSLVQKRQQHKPPDCPQTEFQGKQTLAAYPGYPSKCVPKPWRYKPAQAAQLVESGLARPQSCGTQWSVYVFSLSLSPSLSLSLSLSSCSGEAAAFKLFELNYLCECECFSFTDTIGCSPITSTSRFKSHFSVQDAEIRDGWVNRAGRALHFWMNDGNCIRHHQIINASYALPATTKWLTH